MSVNNLPSSTSFWNCLVPNSLSIVFGSHVLSASLQLPEVREQRCTFVRGNETAIDDEAVR